MKIGVIGANGNLGSIIVKLALTAGHDVKAFVFMGECLEKDVEVQDVNLFDLTKNDIENVDVLISAFGSGFKSDPIINKQAFEKYIDLLDNSNKQLITIAGAGSLYTDDTHSLYEYQLDSHPAKLKKISENIRLGVDEIEKVNSFPWTVVCPSRKFDLDGPATNDYIIGTKSEIIYNDDQNSYVSYHDLAKAMIDIATSKQYNHQVITVASRNGGV